MALEKYSVDGYHRQKTHLLHISQKSSNFAAYAYCGMVANSITADWSQRYMTGISEETER